MFVSAPPEGPGHHGCHIPETLQQDLEMVGVLRNTAMITLMIILSVVAFNTDTDAVTTKSSWHLLHKWKEPEELLAAYINPVRGILSNYRYAQEISSGGSRKAPEPEKQFTKHEL